MLHFTSDLPYMFSAQQRKALFFSCVCTTSSPVLDTNALSLSSCVCLSACLSVSVSPSACLSLSHVGPTVPVQSVLFHMLRHKTGPKPRDTRHEGDPPWHAGQRALPPPHHGRLGNGSLRRRAGSEPHRAVPPRHHDRLHLDFQVRKDRKYVPGTLCIYSFYPVAEKPEEIKCQVSDWRDNVAWHGLVAHGCRSLRINSSSALLRKRFASLLAGPWCA